MDEPALRTLFSARALGVLNPVALDMLWTVLDLDWQTRKARYEAAIKSGLSEQEAMMQPSEPIRAYTENLAALGKIDRRRVKEHIEMIIQAGMCRIVDRRTGYYDLEVFHWAPSETSAVIRYDPQACFEFIREVDRGVDASIESINRGKLPELQREASPGFQRHRSAGPQRAANQGRPDTQHGNDRGSTSSALCECLPETVEGVGPDLDGSRPDPYGVPPSKEEVAPPLFRRTVTGAPLLRRATVTVRRFSGAPPSPVRCFSGAPVTGAAFPAPTVTGARFSGATVTGARFSGAPPHDLNEEDEEVLTDTSALRTRFLLPYGK